MRDGARTDVGNDPHVPVRMGVEARTGRNLVVGPRPQRAEAHPHRVLVAAKALEVTGIQPAVLEVPEGAERPYLDHALRSWTNAVQAKPTLASVGSPNRAVCRAGSPPGKCFTYSALQAA